MRVVYGLRQQLFGHVQAIRIGTIAENIRYGRLSATNGEVEAAARAAHAHELIERLPRGYATQTDNAGASSSQGTDHPRNQLPAKAARDHTRVR